MCFGGSEDFDLIPPLFKGCNILVHICQRISLIINNVNYIKV